MNFVGSQISDAIQVWDNVQSTVKSRGGSGGGNYNSRGSKSGTSVKTAPAGAKNSLDMTHITPSIIGEISNVWLWRMTAKSVGYFLLHIPYLLLLFLNFSISSGSTQWQSCNRSFSATLHSNTALEPQVIDLPSMGSLSYFYFVQWEAA